MQIHKLHRHGEQLLLDRGVVIVIDVIRAFTTAAYAFCHGAEKILVVADVEEAFLLKRSHPHALLMGERRGERIPGFHFGNSPLEVTQQKVKGATLIQRTSSGTQGVIMSRYAETLLTASFINAEATLKRVQALNPQHVTLLITGTSEGGDEDVALADYLERRLRGDAVDMTPYLDRVVHSASGQVFSSDTMAHFPKEDLQACLAHNKASFAMEVFREKELLVMRPVTNFGLVFS